MVPGLCNIPVCMYACMHVCIYVCMHMCMHICVYACMCIRMYVCMHFYICLVLYTMSEPESEAFRAIIMAAVDTPSLSPVSNTSPGRTRSPSLYFPRHKKSSMYPSRPLGEPRLQTHYFTPPREMQRYKFSRKPRRLTLEMEQARFSTTVIRKNYPIFHVPPFDSPAKRHFRGISYRIIPES